ncbi:hypothetical protein AS026_30895 [Rhizobium altiplani]|uniref:Uncharacterized protein n=1 Tax=Rhizobium altiplani TaxID=1864509 RepID=A0A125Q9K8_9HYPH|nr:hypothetical protein AS026_30895 [Rhizobium altiplani]
MPIDYRELFDVATKPIPQRILNLLSVKWGFGAIGTNRETTRLHRGEEPGGWLECLAIAFRCSRAVKKAE